MNKKKLVLNSAMSLLTQIITIICGFILPQCILSTYGSTVNGLVSSISQFLGFIAFFELGVGSTIQSALYKPLAEKDDTMLSKVVVSGDRFFKTLAKALVLYVLVLVIIYPKISGKEFPLMYSATLIIAISISMFAQYYFGNVNRLLLTADQKTYVFGLIICSTLVINTFLSVILMKLGSSIQLVKFTTSIVYLARPILLNLYVKKHYNLNRSITYDDDPIKQKKNGMAQHLSAYVLDGTDTIVLTVFSTLNNVSVYSVYYLVVSGLKQLITSTMLGSVQAAFGDLWVRGKKQELLSVFGWIEWIFNTITIIVFGCASVLIVPFVCVYTRGINDINYNLPLFGIMLTLAYLFHSLRLPYNTLISACNHYKQTQNSFIFSTFLNIVISIVMVNKYGIIGVTIGTLVSMIFQTIWLIYYNSKNLIKWPLKSVMKQFAVNAVIYILAFLISYKTVIPASYFEWIVLAIIALLKWMLISIIVNFIFYKENIKKCICRILIIKQGRGQATL